MKTDAVKGLLLDIDGVVYNDSQPIPGAADAVAWLRRKKIPFRFITNTTMKSRLTIAAKLDEMGITVKPEEIFSAAYAAACYVRKKAQNSCFLMLLEDAKAEFTGLDTKAEKPDFVVAGDLGDTLTFDILNTAFQKIFAGAKLVALQKNRYWLSDRGYTLDAGAFVAMLEYATGCESVLIGKPTPAFFDLALHDLGLPRESVVMVGDDVESDIRGASQAEIRGVLVRTGKFRPEDLERHDIIPWLTINSIADLPQLPGLKP